MRHFPAESLSILQVWAKGVELCRKSFLKILPLLFPLVLWVYIPSFLLRYNIISAGPVWTLISIIIVYLIGSLFFSAAVYYRTHLILLERKNSDLNALKVAGKRLGKLIIGFIIASILVGVGSLLFFPGIYFLILVWFYFPIIIFDNLNPFKALEATYKLVHGHWWQTAIIVGLPLLIFIAISLLIEYYTIGLNFQNLIYFGQKSTAWHIQNIAKIILTFIFFPFFVSFIVVQLENLRREFTEDFVANLADVPVMPGQVIETVEVK